MVRFVFWIMVHTTPDGQAEVEEGKQFIKLDRVRSFIYLRE